MPVAPGEHVEVRPNLGCPGLTQVHLPPYLAKAGQLSAGQLAGVLSAASLPPSGTVCPFESASGCGASASGAVLARRTMESTISTEPTNAAAGHPLSSSPDRP